MDKIKSEHISDGVVEAAKTAWYDNQHKGTNDRITATIVAALNAWPEGRTVSEVFTAGGDFYSPHMILPLTMENSDD